MITMKSTGNFSHMEKFLANMKKRTYLDVLNKYGEAGVQALSSATPKDTGLTSECWYYQIKQEFGKSIISWENTHFNEGVNIAVILQYGHGTKNGGYVRGRDYINPAIRPIFDEIANQAWKEVQSS
jgi:hypothetical protein